MNAVVAVYTVCMIPERTHTRLHTISTQEKSSNNCLRMVNVTKNGGFNGRWAAILIITFWLLMLQISTFVVCALCW